MEQVIDMLAVVGVIVTVVLFWLGGGRAIYWWRNRQTRSSTWH